MAGGKLTPRQKMINMMYLVLTALLALNISKEIINSFVLINTGLERTTDNFKNKNNTIYAAFDKQELINPAKVKQYNDKAKVVKRLSDDMVKYIEDLKRELMAKADKLEKKKAPGAKGEDTLSQENITLEEVHSKDENNIPTEVLIGQSEDGSKGKAGEMKRKLIEYKDKLKAIAEQVDKPSASKLVIPINTSNPPKNKEGIKETWETQYFHSVPLAPAITLLSKFQSDVRNAESDVISFIYKKIDASDFKFDTLAAKVIPKSNYVVIGQQYEADVFVAAFDSKQNPEILVGKSPIPVDHGVGKYTSRPSGEGVQKWGGEINVKSPDGTIKSYPFESEYISAKPSAVVSPEKMNVLYIGIPNPVSVSVAGVASEKVFASISSGSMVGAGGKGHYNVNVLTQGKATINVTAEMDGKKQNMGAFEFRVKEVPNPVAKVAGKTGGVISKALLSAQAGVIADLENFDFEGVRFTVTSFELTIAGKGRDIMNSKAQGNLFTADMKSMLGKVRLDDKVYFENVKAVGPGGKTRDLSAVSFKIN